MSSRSLGALGELDHLRLFCQRKIVPIGDLALDVFGHVAVAIAAYAQLHLPFVPIGTA